MAGVVLWPDRRPASGANLALTVASTGADVLRRNAIKPEGSFTFYGLDGLPYRIRAAAYDPVQKLYYKGAGEVPPASGAVVIVLEVDGTKPSDASFFER